MKLSGSKMSLAFACQWWARSDVADVEETQSPEAAAGTRKHKALEMICLKAKQTPSDMDQWYKDIAALWGCSAAEAEQVVEAVEGWLCALNIDSSVVYTELALAYDPWSDTARAMDSKGSRDYSSLRDGEIPMTVDLVLLGGHSDALPLVLDFKTGLQANIDDVRNSGQLMICALATSRHFNLAEIVVAYAFVNEDGTARINTHAVDVFDLDEFAGKVKKLAKDIKDNPDPQCGMHCSTKWCKAKSVCPVTREIVKATPEVEPLSLTIKNDEQCARIFAQLALAEQFIADVRKAVKSYVVNHGPVKLDDGSMLTLLQRSRETINCNGNPKAIAALKASLGEAFDVAVETNVSVSKESIKKATAALAKGKQRKALEDQVLDELRSCGAVKVSAYETVDMVKERA